MPSPAARAHATTRSERGWKLNRPAEAVEQLERAVESLQSRLVPSFVEAQVHELLRQGEDMGGGFGYSVSSSE